MHNIFHFPPNHSKKTQPQRSSVKNTRPPKKERKKTKKNTKTKQNALNHADAVLVLTASRRVSV
jgi:hypothetical protein